jgi:putative ABC transport system ATP-binding protein
LILGYVYPESGSILFAGKTMDKHLVWDLRKSVAYVGQNTDIGEGQVLKQIKRYFEFKTNRNLALDNLKIIMNKFLLPEEILNKNIEELSGGERQRMAIIIALLLNRKTFLLDEITSSLDAELKTIIANYFLDNPEWTVITISHDAVWHEHPNVKLIYPEWNNGR